MKTSEATKATGKTMIRVDGLTKHYGSVAAVKGISFDVHAGEVLGFLGPNGAGKTTTMRILTSYLAPTAGRAEIAGFDVFDHAVDARARIGYLPEGTPLYRDMTVLEYLQFIADIRKIPSQQRTRRLRAVVEQCGIGDRLGFLIGELSKGFRQRVGLAQAILHEPEVLILDEPTSGLDPNQIVEIRQVIKHIGESKTVIFSTHIMQEVAATCSRVLIISSGRIAADGKPEDLQRQAQGHMDLVVEFQGGDAQAARTGLEAVAGVAKVNPAQGDGASGDDGPRFVVIAKPGADPRADIFRMAVQKNLVLTEMHLERASLEDVFRTLTSGAAGTGAN